MSNIRDILVQIQGSEAFELLEPYRQASVWKNLSLDNRLLLARLLVLQGARQLAEGHPQVVDSFESASQIASHAPEILYRQADVLSTYRDNIRCLRWASQALNQALRQEPNFLKGWGLLAKVLTDMGLFEGEASHFLEAEEAYERASSLRAIGEEVLDWGDLFWSWAKSRFLLSKCSGEPLDVHRAIIKYREAHDLGCRSAPFLNDFGQSIADLGGLLEQTAYFAEALALFEQAVSVDPSVFEGWYHRACCLQRLKLFDEADVSFSRASEIRSDCGQLWRNWGELDIAVGKASRDKERLESGLRKLARAYELEPDPSHVLASWAEAELILGVQEERLDLIQGARAKIVKSLEKEPNDPALWYLHGSVFNELGHYFDEAGHYEEAIAKFQYGLSLDRRHPLLWYGMALSYLALGERREERASFEKAHGCFAQVLEWGGSGFPQFWNDWGVALMKLAELTEEVSWAEMALEKLELSLRQPIREDEGGESDLEWVYHYGAALDLMGDLKDEPAYFEKAVQIFTQILQIDPSYHEARYRLALALSHLADALCDVELYFKAITLFQLLLQEDPEDEAVHLDMALSLTSLALLVQDVHHPERFHTLCVQAEHHFLQAAALGGVQAYYQLAGIYSIMGHYGQAMHYLERAKFFGALPDLEELLHDEWLENVRQLPVFQEFINRPFA